MDRAKPLASRSAEDDVEPDQEPDASSLADLLGISPLTPATRSTARIIGRSLSRLEQATAPPDPASPPAPPPARTDGQEKQLLDRRLEVALVAGPAERQDGLRDLMKTAAKKGVAAIVVEMEAQLEHGPNYKAECAAELDEAGRPDDAKRLRQEIAEQRVEIMRAAEQAMRARATRELAFRARPVVARTVTVTPATPRERRSPSSSRARAPTKTGGDEPPPEPGPGGPGPTERELIALRALARVVRRAVVAWAASRRRAA